MGLMDTLRKYCIIKKVRDQVNDSEKKESNHNENINESKQDENINESKQDENPDESKD